MLAGAMTAVAEAHPTTRREQAKSERRARIVEATCDILREVGIEDLSMKMVSVRAGVSLQTVYNLFGSKQAILARVFDQDLATFEALVAAAPSANALDRVFDALDIAADLYQADPGFYRATMWRRPAGTSELALEATLREPRIRFWRTMVERAVREGLLAPEVDAAVIGALLIQITGGVLADWIAGEISIALLRLEMKFGFAAALSAFAVGEAAPRLRTLTGDLHRQLSAERRG